MDGRAHRTFRVRVNIERMRRNLSLQDGGVAYTPLDVSALLSDAGARREPDGWWLIPQAALTVVDPSEVYDIQDVTDDAFSRRS